jgi:MYXO-CTERM domain-containing protein
VENARFWPRTSWLVATALTSFALAQGTASADLIDPATIHINGPGGFEQTGPSGVDWVTLPSFNGKFTVENQSGDPHVSVTPWVLVLALPNTSGSISDAITQIGTTAVNITNTSENDLTATTQGGDAYKVLGVTGDQSIKFANFVEADQQVLGISPTSYGMYSFPISSSTFALLEQTPEDFTLTGSLPPGTIIFAYGTGSDGKAYSTAMTNAGVITPFAVTPEPSSMTIAGLGIIGLLAFGLRRRRTK